MGIDANLLPGIDPLSVDLRRLRRKHRICLLTGHLYYELSYDFVSSHVIVECRRCWPHKDSRKDGYLYDLLPTPAQPS